MDFNFKKRYGQNFLKDNNVINKIVSSIAPNDEDLIIEIGLGSGALTKHLVRMSKYYLGYEIDLEVKKFLAKYEGENKLFIYDDFLNRNVKDDIKDLLYKKLYIVGNLPYYITTPIILRIIEQKLDIEECLFMVQKEVALRFSSKPGNREYGAITVLLNHYFDVEYLFEVGRKCFMPSPNVDSAIIKLKKKENRVDVDIDKLNRIIKDAFQFKRKNLRNNLKSYDLTKITNILNEYGFDLSNRAEDLPVDVFVALANRI